jgi:hypothetical protein
MEKDGINTGGGDMPQMLVCYCKVARKPQGTLFQRDFETDIKEVINPNEKSVERYGRPWRFSQPKIYNGYLFGKLGYIASGTETKPFYDEEQHDFIQQTIDTPLTNFVLYAIDLSKQILAFEIKPPDIKYQSFRGAFEKFIAKRPDIGLEIEDFMETSKFIAWVNDVERITLFKATLRVPNPEWSKHPSRIYDYLGTTNADKGKIELIKSKGSTDSLITNQTIIEDVVTYGEEGYSDVYARGEKGERPIIFDSRKSSPSDRMEIDKAMTNDAKLKLIMDMLGKFIVRKFKK